MSQDKNGCWVPQKSVLLAAFYTVKPQLNEALKPMLNFSHVSILLK